MLWICTADDLGWGYRWGEMLAAEQVAAYELEQDLEIERELGPWPSRDGWIEETEVEAVPVHLLESLGFGMALDDL